VTDSAAPLIDITDLAKEYSSGPPLRIARLSVHRHDRIALVGLDEAAAETLLHLVTGAAVPDEGTVLVAGHDTRAIATDTEWLASLDRFGLVTDRAVLLEKMPIAANLAMPLTLSIDPMSDAVLAQVTALGADVGLAPDRLRSEASSLDAEERVRVHLARAIAPGPQVLLLEHPTARIKNRQRSVALGETLRRVSEQRSIGFVALTADRDFAAAAGATTLRIDPATGAVARDGWWQRLWGRTKS
jgi:predicted ABC-type transport system involved in lysophospholipase L1 biosynthesis ATPase subunit